MISPRVPRCYARDPKMKPRLARATAHSADSTTRRSIRKGGAAAAAVLALVAGGISRAARGPSAGGVAAAAVLALVAGASDVRAGDAPKKLSAADTGATVKTILLFPAPSELATRLSGAGVHLTAGPKLRQGVPSPDWAKLPTQDRQLQLGSVLGYLAFAAAAGDMPAVANCFDQVLLGAEALGVDKNSNAYQATMQTRDRIRGNQISSSQVLTRLDDLRRDTLRELASRGDLTFILAAAWLRGSALLAEQVKTDSQAGQLAEFVMRPELVDFIGGMPDPATGAPSPERRAAADRMLAVVRKAAFRLDDFASFVAFADKVLQPSGVRP